MKDNKLIAEFMGESPKGFYEKIEDGYNKIPYAESWDWLMPVVEKINTLDNCKYQLEINHCNATVRDIEDEQSILQFLEYGSMDTLIKTIVSSQNAPTDVHNHLNVIQ